MNLSINQKLSYSLNLKKYFVPFFLLFNIFFLLTGCGKEQETLIKDEDFSSEKRELKCRAKSTIAPHYTNIGNTSEYLLSFFSSHGSPINRRFDFEKNKEEFQNIHPLLSTDALLTPCQYEDVTVFKLEKLTPTFMKEIKTKFSNPALSFGIGVFDADFWTMVEIIQNKGVQIAFFGVNNPESDSLVKTETHTILSGLYDPVTPIIFLSPYTMTSTLMHEFRHHIQSEQITKKRNQKYLRGRKLSSKCAEFTRSYFNELDASIDQLTSIAKQFKNIENYQNMNKNSLPRSFSPNYLITQIFFFLSSTLSYPLSRYDASHNGETMENTCPADFMQRIANLNETYRDKIEPLQKIISKTAMNFEKINLKKIAEQIIDLKSECYAAIRSTAFLYLEEVCLVTGSLYLPDINLCK